MDVSVTGHPFQQSAPFRHTVIIIHFFAMSLAFLICYPYSTTQQSHSSSQKRYLISLGLTALLAFVGFVTGWFIQYSPTTSSSDTILHVALKLSLFLLASLDLALEYISSGFCILYQHGNILPSLQRNSHQQDHQHSTTIRSWVYRVPEIVKISIRWITLYLGYFYLVFSIFVLTSTSGSINEWWLSLAMGIGFILYGSLAFMHLVNIITLGPHSNVEYYEALLITSWGFLSFMWWDTAVVGSSWKAINVGLLWTTGGILSLAVTFQSWVPILQKRNVINSIIMCLTGKGILSGYSNEDAYGDELQTTLGYILIIGGVARFVQVMFRKSTTDNLPRLYERASVGSLCDDVDDDETCVDDLDVGKRRENDYELTYRQLTGAESVPTTVCKHQSVYASITMICGVLSCFMAVSGGLVFIGTIPGWVATMRYYVNDPSTYVNVLLAISFLWTAYLLALCSLYKSSTNATDYLDVATADYSELPISLPSSGIYDIYNLSSAGSRSSASSMSHITQQHQGFSSAPPTSAPPLSKIGSNGSASPPMRPSQYRAKRRSLLISTSMQDNTKAVRPASTSGSISVGGVLPDEVSIYGDVYVSSPVHTLEQPSNDHQNAQQASPTHQRRSWRSSMSSSPPSISTSTPGHSYAARQQQSHNGDDGNHLTQAVYKTESGKRKERQSKSSKRPQAVAASSTLANPYHAEEHQQQDDVFSGGGRPQCDSSECLGSDSRIF